jgi:hypothetical protein
MPLSSDLNQQLSLQLKALKTTIQEITESHCFEHEHGNFKQTLEYLKSISKQKQAILKTQSQLQTNKQPRRQEELNTILNTTINFPCIASDPNANNEQTVKYAIDYLMPKSVALMHLDALIEPTEKKLEQLTKNAAKNDNYREVQQVATQIVEASKNARDVLYRSHHLKNGLKEMEQCIHAVYTDANIDILATHRGDPNVNAALNLLRQLAGYAVWVITLPLRLYDNHRTQTYMDSWFKERQTDALQIFGTFKRQATPKTYCCPITTKIMQEPVHSPAEPEYSFDKHAISKWLRTTPKNPLTNKYMDEDFLFPNTELKKQIDLFNVNAENTQQALADREIYSPGV